MAKCKFTFAPDSYSVRSDGSLVEHDSKTGAELLHVSKESRNEAIEATISNFMKKGWSRAKCLKVMKACGVKAGGA